MIDVRRIDANDKPLNPDGTHIVYWMTSARRARWNHALDHAIELANEHNKPLIVVECLASGHRWANDRIHTFVLQGMIDNRKLFENTSVTYVPYVETKKNQARGLLHSFSTNAVAVVIDDFPTYMPRDVAKRAKNLAECSVRCIDSNGIIPIRAPERSFSTAHSFRRYIHQNVLNFISSPPNSDPMSHLNDVPNGSHIVSECFNQADVPQTPLEFIWRVSEASREGREALAVLDIDHEVPPVDNRRGGSLTARTELKKFIEQRLPSYHIDRNHQNVMVAVGSPRGSILGISHRLKSSMKCSILNDGIR